ncbi:NAD(P)/FAD-dependent oxidoreductase [Pseudomaricurvus sp. HS19]|uniref:NAD(P)/FAD-dependent oxidoreductase n=1 Tax=Pseudomaricurvus sp. HS19 TaxID=2692626 RepID=UPI00136F27D5|nr:NAD(P)/FAD-dependent oxidoreductase [Pseudomaricurvus sp. HS19]MYM63976.1 NAD(P)-binding protein [Pseudomaricurvus sp. HS19]
MTTAPLTSDIIVIGAGPSGAIAAALLRQQGYDVLVLEKQHFPRFSIGESLLPQCMEFIEQAGMLDAVQAESSFQYKNGAAFHWQGMDTGFDFRQKFSPGHGTTYQVQRGRFDQILADEAERFGARILYGHEIIAFEGSDDGVSLQVRNEAGEVLEARGRFALDASGFGRVLPRLLDLETPSDFPVRASLFTHIEDRIDDPAHDRDKILITVHPEHRDVWFWLIPFGNGRCSLGVVAEPAFLAQYSGEPTERLQALVNEDPNLARLLANARWDTPAREINGYSCNVKSLWGPGYALLGNAGEFLDPVFSSGVTIAMKSANLANDCLHRQLQGETVDWEADYAVPLKKGVDTFRTFVSAWYDGRFQDVIFAKNQSATIREMISSILAGYAWDTNNPYVKESERRLNVLVETCRSYS